MNRIIACAALALASPAVAATDDDIYAPGREIIADIQKVVTPDGVDETFEVELGGARQIVNVRGADRSNPILLFVHGGPGSTEMPVAWTFQRAWEDFFTVVQWDQRGAGKSYLLNDPEALQQTMTPERYRADAIELIELLKKKYAKRKIILVGHSWGSVVGLGVAEARPDLLHAYVGIGQVIDFRENERVGFQWTLDQAAADGDKKALAELESIKPYPGDGPLEFDKTNVERDWSIHYGALAAGRDNADFYFHAPRLAPLYSPGDRKAMDDGSLFSVTTLWPRLTSVTFKDVRRIETPVFMFLGRKDFTTPSAIAAAWMKDLKAPKKETVWFEHSAHLPMAEEPGRVLVALVDKVRPFAKEKPAK